MTRGPHQDHELPDVLHSAYLLDVLDALDDVAPLHSLLDRVGVAQDGKMLIQSLLHQACGQGGEVSQVPQHLQHLGGKTLLHRRHMTPTHPITVASEGLPKNQDTHFACRAFRSSFPANPADQTEEFLSNTITLHLPALEKENAALVPDPHIGIHHQNRNDGLKRQVYCS